VDRQVVGMSQFTVSGSYLARRGYWQNFTKTLEAVDPAGARERAFSQVGGSHHVSRQYIRIATVTGISP